ncbi:MAG: hypothetical protein IJH39_05370 [Clostridia bacterium]|nr:hypothetical protein [Clostridia bacterium]
MFDVRANVHMVYPNKDEVYYTSVIFEVNEYSGELKADEESLELRWFQINALPDNISPFQIGYIEKFVNALKNNN